MKIELLDALNLARAAKRRTALIRPLADGVPALLVDGELIMGTASTLTIEFAEACLRRDQSRKLADANGDVFVQIFNPPLRLFIIGAVHISQALAPLAKMAGYDVTIVDPRGAFATTERFPDISLNDDWPDEALQSQGLDRRSAVVALTHDPKIDDPGLDIALRSDAFYIAALGSRRTHAGRQARLLQLGHEQATIDRIHGPAGLDIGAISPVEIAISIMAEMVAKLRTPKG